MPSYEESLLSSRVEKLERQVSQLLENQRGSASSGVDTEEDLARLRRQLAGLELTVSTFQQDVVSAIDADLETSRAKAHQIVSTELADTRQAMRQDCEDIFEALYKDAEVGIGEMVNEKIDRVAQLMQQEFAGSFAETLAEQREHAEAIDNLLTMIDGTVTREDFGRASEAAAQQAEVRLQQLDEKVLALVQQQAEGQAEDQNEMAAQVQERLVALEEQLAGHADVLQQQSTEFPEIMEGRASQLSEDMKSFEETLEQRVVDVQRQCIQAVESANVWGETIQSQSVITDSVVASVKALEAKLDGAAQTLRLEAEHQVKQGAKMTEHRLELLEKKLSSTAKGLNDTVAERMSSVTTLQQDSHQRLESKIGGLQRQLDHNIQKADSVLEIARVIETRVEKELSDQTASFGDKMDAATAKVDRVIADATDKRLESSNRLDSLQEQLTRVSTSAKDKHAEMDTQVGNVRQQLMQQLNDAKHELTLALTSEVSKVKADVGLEKSDFMNQLTKLEGKFDASSRTLSDRMTSQADNLTEQIKLLQRTTTDKTTQQSSMIQSHHDQLAGLFSAIDSRLSERTSLVDSRLSELGSTVTANHAALNAICSRAESKLADRAQSIENKLAATQHQLNASLQSLEAKIGDIRQQSSDLISDRLNSMDRKLQAVTNESIERCSQVDIRISQWGTEFTEQNRQHQTAMQADVDDARTRIETCEAKQSKMESSTAAVIMKTKDEVSSLSKSVDVSEKRLWEKLGTMDIAAERTKNQSEGKLQSLEEAKGALENDMKKATLDLAMLTSTVMENKKAQHDDGRSIEKRLRELEQNVNAATNALRTETSAYVTATDGKLRSQHDLLQGAVAQLQQKISDKVTSLDMRLATLTNATSENLANATRLSRQKDAEHDKKLKEVFDAINKTEVENTRSYQRLESQILDRDTVTLERITEVNEAANANKREVTALCASLESTMTDRSKDVEELLTERHETLAHDMAHLMKQNERRIGEVDVQQTDKITSVDMRLATLSNATSEKLASLESKFTERTDDIENRTKGMHDKLVDTVTSNATQAAEDRKAIDRKFSTRSTSLLERQTKTDGVVHDAREQVKRAQAQSASVEQSLRKLVEGVEARLNEKIQVREDAVNQQFASAYDKLAEVDSGGKKALTEETTAREAKARYTSSKLEQLLDDLPRVKQMAQEAESKASATATRLFLVENGLEEARQAVQNVDAQLDETNTEFSKLEEQLSAIEADTADLAVEVSLAASASTAEEQAVLERALTAVR